MRNYRGTKNAEICVVQYGDFQCFESRNSFYAMEHYLVHYPMIGHCFRHVPHKEYYHISFMAAIASEIAGKENKFWDMSELLFQRSGCLTKARIAELMSDLDIVNESKSFEDISDTEAFQNVIMDQESALQ